jgi:multicomponent Na+:H+ antiporter subunit D
MNWLLPVPVVLPLFTALVLFLLRRSQRWQERLSLLSLAVNLAVALSLLNATAGGEMFFHRMGLWPFPYGIILAADRLTGTMLALSAAIVGACVVFADGYLSKNERREVFHPLIHFQLMGIQGAFLTGDLFNLFVFFEVMLMSTYALLSFYYNLDQLEMSFKYTCLNMIASILFLVGVSFIYAQMGTVNMADLSVKIRELGPDPLMLLTAFIFLFVFSMKAALFPVHLWLPSAHAISPTHLGAILAGVLVKVGIYVIIRCATLIFPLQFESLQPVLMTIALATIVWGALGTLPQRSLKRILAYSTINQLGYIAFGVSLLSPLGIAAAVFYLVSHAFLKSSMLLGAGLTQKLTGTVDLDEMGGLMQKAPFASAIMLVGFMSLSGIPPLNGFFSKFFLLQAGFTQGAYVATGLVVVMSLVSLYYNFNTYQRMAWGAGGADAGTAPVSLYASAGFLASFAVIFGLGVPWLYEWSQLVATQITQPDLYIAAMRNAL